MALVLPCVTCGRTFALSPIMTASLVAMPHCSQMCSSAAAAGRGTHALRSSSHDEHRKTASGTCGAFLPRPSCAPGEGFQGPQSRSMAGWNAACGKWCVWKWLTAPEPGAATQLSSPASQSRPSGSRAWAWVSRRARAMLRVTSARGTRRLSSQAQSSSAPAATTMSASAWAADAQQGAERTREPAGKDWARHSGSSGVQHINVFLMMQAWGANLVLDFGDCLVTPHPPLMRPAVYLREYVHFRRHANALSHHSKVYHRHCERAIHICVSAYVRGWLKRERVLVEMARRSKRCDWPHQISRP